MLHDSGTTAMSSFLPNAPFINTSLIGCSAARVAPRWWLHRCFRSSRRTPNVGCLPAVRHHLKVFVQCICKPYPVRDSAVIHRCAGKGHQHFFWITAIRFTFAHQAFSRLALIRLFIPAAVFAGVMSRSRGAVSFLYSSGCKHREVHQSVQASPRFVQDRRCWRGSCSHNGVTPRLAPY